MTIALIRQGKSKRTMALDQHKQGEDNVTMASPKRQQGRDEMARQGHLSMINTGGAKGV